ncbi:hypothetical protein AAMO2058_000239300 [Amorphochlora amoebiformis]
MLQSALWDLPNGGHFTNWGENEGPRKSTDAEARQNHSQTTEIPSSGLDLCDSFSILDPLPVLVHEDSYALPNLAYETSIHLSSPPHDLSSSEALSQDNKICSRPLNSRKRLAPITFGSATVAPYPQARRKRKTACVACKASKSQCDHIKPCKRCVIKGIDCRIPEKKSRRAPLIQVASRHLPTNHEFDLMTPTCFGNCSPGEGLANLASNSEATSHCKIPGVKKSLVQIQAMTEETAVLASLRRQLHSTPSEK